MDEKDLWRAAKPRIDQHGDHAATLGPALTRGRHNAVSQTADPPALELVGWDFAL